VPAGTFKVAEFILTPRKAPTIGNGFCQFTITEVKPVQLPKAATPILVTELGMITEVNLKQLAKHYHQYYLPNYR
jgi:hypothetical protein